MITTYYFPDLHPAPVLCGADADCTPEWVHVTAPSPEECMALSTTYNIPLDFINAALDFNERPRMEHTQNTLLILTRVPLHDSKNKSVLFITCPIAIILTEQVTLTVCLRENIIESLIFPGLKNVHSRRQIQIALTILFRTSTQFIENLRHMNNLVSVIEKTLHLSMQNKELINMLRIEKSLIFFFTAIKENHSVIDKMSSFPLIRLTPEERELLIDTLIENKQASDMADVFTQIIGSVSDAFGAIVSNNLNKVMKLLTGLTLIFMIPSTIGAIYGMNVALPFQSYPHAFTYIACACLFISLIFALLFWKMKWL